MIANIWGQYQNVKDIVQALALSTTAEQAIKLHNNAVEAIDDLFAYVYMRICDKKEE